MRDLSCPFNFLQQMLLAMDIHRQNRNLFREKSHEAMMLNRLFNFKTVNHHKQGMPHMMNHFLLPSLFSHLQLLLSQQVYADLQGLELNHRG